MASTSTNPLCHFAPVQPPAGQTSNLVDPPSLANTAIAICAIMTAWATVFVAGRLYVNFRKLSLADCKWLEAILSRHHKSEEKKLTVPYRPRLRSLDF